MATPAHELLKIDAARLKTANDAFMRVQYETVETEARKNAATAAQLLALNNAFEALNTPEKRAEYLATHERETPTRAVKDNSAQNILYVIDPKDAPAIKTAYAQFVRENYKNEPDYAQFKPQEYSFNSLEDFKTNPVYRKIPAEQRDAFVKGGFPLKFLELSFKNEADANKFRNAMMDKGLIQEEQATNSPRMGR